MQMSMHKSVQNESITGDIEKTLYDIVEGAFKISF